VGFRSSRTFARIPVIVGRSVPDKRRELRHLLTVGHAKTTGETNVADVNYDRYDLSHFLQKWHAQIIANGLFSLYR
jgi:hypothetical protein